MTSVITCHCGKEFKTVDVFLAHTEAGHAGTTVTCGCGESFADADVDAFLDHVEATHPAGPGRLAAWLARGRSVLGTVETAPRATS